MNFRYRFFILILIIGILAGCAAKPPLVWRPPAESLALVDSVDIDFVDDLDIDSLNLAIERSLHYYEVSGNNRFYRLADRLVSTGQMKESLLTFRQIIKSGGSIADKKSEIRRNFDVYQAAGQDGNGGVLFTGYYVPLLNGSLTRTEKYKYPVYKTPPELVARKSDTYYSRKEIDAGGILRDKNLEMIWVDDPVELFFLHIQGSGEIKLENGTVLTVSAAGTNGRQYRSIASYMLEKGIIGIRESSNRNIKKLLKEKKDEDLYEILGYNERYIFFHFVADPTGSLGEPVTTGRTIATDPDIFPPGALSFIRLRRPVLDGQGKLTNQRIYFSRFVLNQDKGSAIKGPGRVDLFCGFGETAESVAGTLKEKGELYFLVKK